MAISEDFDYASCPFAIEAVFTTASGTARVKGHFTEATEGVSIATGQIEAHDASFSCNSSEVADVKNGNAVAIDGTAFTVKRKQRIGTGDTLFYLKTP